MTIARMNLLYSKSFSTLNSGIAHEIRNPISMIQGHHSLLGDYFGGALSHPAPEETNPIEKWDYHVCTEEVRNTEQDDLQKADQLL